MSDVEERMRRRAVANGVPLWGEYGSSTSHERYAQPAPRSRRKCVCGCNTRATHAGAANGVALMSGCELHVRRWVRDGYQETR